MIDIILCVLKIFPENQILISALKRGFLDTVQPSSIPCSLLSKFFFQKRKPSLFITLYQLKGKKQEQKREQKG
jgi:hypothetical protein